MKNQIKTMTELVNKVKILVGKGRYFTVQMEWKSNFFDGKQTENAEWSIYHEDITADRAQSANLDKVFEKFQAQWKAHKEKPVEQKPKKELAAVGSGPEVK